MTGTVAPALLGAVWCPENALTRLPPQRALGRRPTHHVNARQSGFCPSRRIRRAGEIASAGDDPVNSSDPSGLAPQPPTLSPEEEQALSDKANGLPYDRAAYNRAIRKLQQAGKYGGQRNKRKQRGKGKPKYTIVPFQYGWTNPTVPVFQNSPIPLPTYVPGAELSLYSSPLVLTTSSFSAITCGSTPNAGEVPTYD